MSNVRKKISELTQLTSASLDTTIVGVDNGTTYKIELDTLADAVTSRINILDRNRLSELESVTSSFESKGRNIISSSAQITSFGFVSTSVNITSLNSFTSSQTTLNDTITNEINIRLQTASFNSYTSSINTLSTSVDSRLDILETFSTSADARITDLENAPVPTYISSGPTAPGTSVVANTTYVGINFSGGPDFQFNSDGTITFPDTTIQSTAFLGIPTGSISSSIQLTELNQFTHSIDSRVDGLEAATASYLTSLNGVISGSSQLTSSYDTRYAPSASYLTSLNGAFSSSIQTLGGSDVYSSSAQLPNGLISGSSQLTASYDTRYATSASYLTSLNGAISSSSQLTSSFDTRYALSASFVSSSNVASIQTITSASYAALTPVSGTLYIIIG